MTSNFKNDPSFLNPTLSLHNLDRYVIRKQILDALSSQTVNMTGSFLDIGCGKMPYRNLICDTSTITEYIGLDIEDALTYDKSVRPDFTWDGITMPFENERFDSSMATEVLEHCPDPEIVLKEVYRVLKPGGYFFFTVPFIWNLHEVPNDQYRYTPFALQRHLENSGFSDIEVKASGGWHASMAMMLGLWVRRGPLSSRQKKILGRIVRVVMRFLLKKDNKNAVKFVNGQMLSGIYGWAYKKP